MFRSISWATCIWENPKLRPLFVNCLLSSSLMFVNCLLLPPVSSQSPAHRLVNFGSGDLDALSWPCTIPNSEHRMKTLPCLISLQVLGSHWPQSFLYSTVHPLRLRVAVWPYLNLSQDFLRTLSLFCAMCTWSLVCILTHRILKWSVFAFSFYPPLSELTKHKSWFCQTSALITNSTNTDSKAIAAEDQLCDCLSWCRRRPLTLALATHRLEVKPHVGFVCQSFTLTSCNIT